MQKRGANKKKAVKTREIHSHELISDKDFQKFKSLYSQLKKTYNISGLELLNIIEKQINIPCSIFTKKLSALETISKYLKENLELSCKEIASLINRSEKTIWQAHKSANKKHPSKLIVKDFKFTIDASILSNRKLSILENIATYLKKEYDLKFSQIAELLKRDQRTIWTVYNRAQKKIKNEEK